MSIYQVTDPSTNQVVETFPTATDAEIDAAVAAAADAFTTWRRRPIAEHAQFLAAIAEQYRARRDELADIITLEMGKPRRDALGELDLVARIFDYYAENAEAFAADQEIDTPRGSAVVRSEPIGVLLGIMPWNYPHYQVARFIAPNLALGNTIVLKHAPSCPRSALAVVEMLAAAGVPAGVYENVFATNEQVARIIDMPAVQGVSLTGSERAGRAVGELAGRAMKKVVLELGGSDPFIVLPDADLDRAVTMAVNGRMQNAGQACTASKRFLVHDEVYDEFLSRFTSAVEKLNVGDPREDVNVGPLSSEAAAAGVVKQIEDAVSQGAKVEIGGGRIDTPGAYVQPTILTGVTPDARAYREEIFGPVAVVYRIGSTDEAVEVANDTPYGLGAVVFGEDGVDDVVSRLDVGMVAVNQMSMTSPELPFGGVKASGIGRELGPFGMAEFVNLKLIRR